MKRRYLLPLAALCLSGCGGEFLLPASYRTLPLDQDAIVHVGEKVGLTGDGVTELEIQSVKDDSRCPVNADCIWAGTASVTGELHKSPFLLTADAPPPESFSVEYLKDTTTALTVRPRYKLSFTQLSPEAQLGKAIAQSDYKITLRITRL
jgi:hypothetical protein